MATTKSTLAAQPVRVALIGAGYMAGRLADEVLKSGNELCGITNRTPANAEAQAKRLKDTFGVDVPVFPDVPSLLDGKNRPDAVALVVIPSAHSTSSGELDAIKRGMPFISDKPIGLERELALQILRAANEDGVPAAVNYQFCSGEAYAAAKAWVASRTVTGVNMNWGGDARPPVAWWSKTRMSGGPVHEQLAHKIRGAQELLGPKLGSIVGVRALGFHVQDLAGRPDEDAVPEISIGEARFENGLVGRIFHSCTKDHPGAVGVADTGEVARLSPTGFTVTRGDEVLQQGRIDHTNGPEVGIEIFTDDGQRGVLTRTEFTVTDLNGDLLQMVPNSQNALTPHMNQFLEGVRQGDLSDRLKDGRVTSYQKAIETNDVTLAAKESIEAGGVWMNPKGGRL